MRSRGRRGRAAWGGSTASWTRAPGCYCCWEAVNARASCYDDGQLPRVGRAVGEDAQRIRTAGRVSSITHLPNMAASRQFASACLAAGNKPPFSPGRSDVRCAAVQQQLCVRVVTETSVGVLLLDRGQRLRSGCRPTKG